MDMNQGEFDFDAQGTNAGWEKWREQIDQRKRAFEQRWGIILGKRVKITLRDFEHPFTGIITIEQASSKSSPSLRPLFRVGHVTFHHEDIISLIVANESRQSPKSLETDSQK
jgi:hypothetical protein